MLGILHDKDMVERGRAASSGVVNVQINLNEPQDVVVRGSISECGEDVQARASLPGEP